MTSSSNQTPSPDDPVTFPDVGGCGSRTIYDALTDPADDTFNADPLSSEEIVGVVARALFAAGVDRSGIERIIHGANEDSPDRFFELYAKYDAHDHIENDRYEAWWDYIPQDVAAEIVPIDISGVVNQRMRNDTRYFEIECLPEFVDDLTESDVKQHPQIGTNSYGYYHKGAGFERNAMMAETADIFIALWDGDSNGTEDMINRADDNGAVTKVFQFNCPETASKNEKKRVRKHVQTLLPDRFESPV